MLRKIALILFTIPFTVTLMYATFGGIHQVEAAAAVWNGGGTDGSCGGSIGDGNKWSCAANWSGGVIPTSADTVTFNGTSTKNATVDASFAGTIASLSIASGYTGTITLATPLVTSTSFSQAAGTFNSASQTLTIGSTFSLTAGSFTAPSTIMHIVSTFTISGTPTFLANSGTLDFNGATSGTLGCNNATFNLVTFTHSNGAKTVSSNCSLPLGANPSLGSGIASIVNNGTLSGSGTFTLSGAYTHNASTSTLSGFSGIVDGGALTIANSAILNLSAYTTVDLNGAFSLTSGTFTAPTATMTAASTFTISGGTFTANSGTLTFDGATSATLSCNNALFSAVIFAQTNGAKTISSNCSFPLGLNPTIGSGVASIINNGTFSGSGTITFAGAYTHNASTSTLSGFSGLVVNGNYVQQNSASLDLSSYTLADFNGTSTTVGFSLVTGTFTAPSGNMTLSDGFSITGGTFNANGGTLTFDGSTGTLSCNNATLTKAIFNTNASKTINANCSLPLGSNPTVSAQTILNGTLSGSGTITFSTTLTMNAGAALSGFTGQVSQNVFTVSGATLDYSTFTTVDMQSRLTLSSGSIKAPTLTNLKLKFDLIATGGTFNANGGTVEIYGGSGTLSCNNSTFNLVILNSSGGSKTINSDCSLPLGNNPSINASTGTTILNGTLSGTGTLSSNGPFTLNSTGILSGFNGLSILNSQGFTLSGATLDLGSYTTANFTGNFIMGSGTFTAPTGSVSFGRTFTITGGSFNANGGTVTFNGLTSTLACNNVAFHVVVLNATNQTKTIGNDCSLPLGNNPQINGVILNGSLSGSGILNHLPINNTLSLTLNTGANLSGFTAIEGAILTVNGANLDASTLSLTNFCNLTLNSGSFVSPISRLDIGCSLTQTGGTFTAPSGVLSIGQGFTISGAAIFNVNGGTVDFTGSTGGTLSCNNVSFSHVTFTHTTVIKTISSNCSFPLGNNPTVSGPLSIQGTLIGSGMLTAPGTGTSTYALHIIGPTGSLSGFSGLNTGRLELASAASLDLSSYTSVNTGYLNIFGGSTFTAPAQMSVDGIGYISGTFNANHGTVTLNAGANLISSPQTGTDLTLYNLTKTTSGSIIFPAYADWNKKVIVQGQLILVGSAATLLPLSSSTPGSLWQIDPQGPRHIAYVATSDSSNRNSTSIAAYGTNSDSGNNSGWDFTLAPINLALIAPVDRDSTTSTRPAFTWRQAVNNALSTISSYTLTITNTNGTIFTIPNIPVSSDTETSLYSLKLLNATDNNPDNDYLSLITKSAPSWGAGQNDGALSSGSQVWSVTATDGVANTQTASRSLVLSQLSVTPPTITPTPDAPSYNSLPGNALVSPSSSPAADTILSPTVAPSSSLTPTPTLSPSVASGVIKTSPVGWIIGGVGSLVGIGLLWLLFKRQRI
jgi:fibronectin-binding autotransporter adhesin